jgi:hypothetical protein
MSMIIDLLIITSTSGTKFYKKGANYNTALSDFTEGHRLRL